MNTVAFARSGEGGTPPRTPPIGHPKPRWGEFQMINGGDFRMIIDSLQPRQPVAAAGAAKGHR